jgi:hypothetical protein
MTSPSGRKSHYIWRAVLLLPLVGMASVAAYSRMDPTVWNLQGLVQYLWMLPSAALTAGVCVKSEAQRVAVRTGRSTRPRA